MIRERTVDLRPGRRLPRHVTLTAVVLGANLLLGYAGTYPIGITWYVLKNTVFASLGLGHRDPTFDEGLLLPFTYSALLLLAFAAISGIANYFLVRIWPFDGKWLWPIAAALLVLPGLLVIASPASGWR